MRNCVNERRINTPLHLKQALSRAINLREVDLKVASFDDHDKLHFLTEFPFCLEGLQFLSKVTVHLSEHIWKLGYLGDLEYNKMVDGMMNHLSQRLGVRGIKMHTISKSKGLDPTRVYFFDDTTKWTWEAYPGQLMDWSKKLGRVWKFPFQRKMEIKPSRDVYLDMEQLFILEITWTRRYWIWELDYCHL